MQLSVKTDARSEFLRAPPVTLFPLFKKTDSHRAWPRAAQDFKILEPFFFPSDSFNGLTCVSRGSAALPPPCVLPKKGLRRCRFSFHASLPASDLQKKCPARLVGALAKRSVLPRLCRFFCTTFQARCTSCERWRCSVSAWPLHKLDLRKS